MDHPGEIRRLNSEYFDLLKTSFPEETRSRLVESSQEELARFAAEALQQTELELPDIGNKAALEYQLEDLLRSVTIFWNENGERLRESLCASDAYVTVLEGQHFVGNLGKTIRRLGCYFDSVAIVDPIHVPDANELEAICNSPQGRQIKVQFVTRIANILRCHGALNADEDFPVMLCLPDLYYDASRERQDYQLAAEFLGEKCLECEKISSLEEFASIATRLTETDIERIQSSSFFQDLIDRFDKKASLLWQFEPLGGINEALTRLSEATFSFQLGSLLRYTKSSLFSARGAFEAALTYGADPVIYKGNQPFYDWMATRAAEDVSCDISPPPEDQIVAQALVASQFSFLEALTFEELHRIRENGSLEGLREQLRMTRREYSLVSRRDIAAGVEFFSARVLEILNEYRTRANELEEDLRRRNITAGVFFLAAASLTVAGIAIPGSIVLGAICGGVSIALGGKSALDVYKTYRDSNAEISNVDSSPMTLLLDVMERTQTDTELPGE